MYAENFTGSPPKWLQGTVVKVTGPLSYHVKLESGHTVRRHVDSLRVRHALVQQNKSHNIDPLYLPDIPTSPVRQTVHPNPTPRTFLETSKACGEIWPWTVIPQA